MAASRRQRPLGSFERAQVLTGGHFPFNLVAVVGLDGTLETGRLRAALDEVQRRHPLLRASVGGRGRRAVFRIGGAPPLPLRRVAAGDWRELVEGELATGFEVAEGPLARCVVLAPLAGPATIVLTFHHAIADGIGVAHLARELLQLLGPGPAPSREAEAPLPPRADERFPAPYRRAGGGLAGAGFLLRQAVEEASFRWRRRRRPPRPAAVASACRVLTTDLPAAETSALVRASYLHRASLTAALEAAMLLAVSGCRYGGERLPQRYFAFPILRPFLEPPVDATVLGCYTTLVRLTLEVGGGDGLWDVAAAITRQIYGAVGRGESFLASIWSPLSMRMVLGRPSWRMGTTAVSYTGAVGQELDRPAGPGGPGVRELHAFVSNFPVGPEYAAQARIFRGRLVWDVVYLEVDMTAEEAAEIARRMKEILVAAAPVEAAGP